MLGILGVSVNSLIGGAHEAHVAFAVLVVTCIFVAAYAARRVYLWQSSIYPKGYAPISVFVRYSTTDGKSIVHETFRHLQIKHTFLTGIDHRYYWTGTKPPVISSHLQTVREAPDDPVTGFKVRKVRFERPRLYNETEVVHIRSELDDSDSASQPFVSVLVDLPTTIVQFRVELLHCTKPSFAGMKATLERQLKTANAHEAEKITDVPFDLNSRSFDYLLKRPEPGYQYKLRWDRPVMPSPRGRNGRQSAKNS